MSKVKSNTEVYAEIIADIAARAAECVRLGYRRLILPQNSKKGLQSLPDADIIYAGTLEQALKECSLF